MSDAAQRADGRAVGGPYFEGQKAGACGHYYPDAIRVSDRKDANADVWRLVDCIFCGRFEFHLRRDTCEHLAELTRECLAGPGVVAKETAEDVAAWRASERERLRAKK